MKFQKKINSIFHGLLFQICFPVLHSLYSQFKKDPSNKVLVISLNYLGDVLIGTPAIRGLKKLHPDMQIDIFVKKDAIPLIQHNPDISNCHIDLSPHGKSINTPVSLLKLLLINCRVLASLYRQNYDVVFDFTGSFESAFFTGLIGKKKRYGLCWRPHFKKVFTDTIDGYAKTQHLRFINCDIIEKAGFSIDREQCQYSLNIPENDNMWAENYIKNSDSKITVIIAPFAGWQQKEWNLSNFIELAKKLSECGIKVLFIGSKSDAEKLTFYKSIFNSQIVNLCGKTTLIESAALIKHSSLFVGLDSSQSHIADALHTKSIVIFGPTNPLFHQIADNPYVKVIYKQISCSPQNNQKYCHENCFSFTCPNNHLCMESVSIDDVFNTIKALLPENAMA